MDAAVVVAAAVAAASPRTRLLRSPGADMGDFGGAADDDIPFRQRGRGGFVQEHGEARLFGFAQLLASQDCTAATSRKACRWGFQLPAEHG